MPYREELTDEELALRAQAGSERDFDALVNRYAPAVYRLARGITRGPQDAEDVVQETFLRAYRQIERFESRASFATWLYRIAVNCSLDLLRQRPRRAEQQERPDDDERAADPDANPSPERLAFSAQIQAKVTAALGALTPAERAAFLLRHFEGQSIEDIGRVLGLRTSATKHTVFRAVQKVRRALEPVLR